MKHPYTKYESTPAWRAVSAALAALEDNKDVELTTAREYVVGYLCKRLAGRKVLTNAAINPVRKRKARPTSSLRRGGKHRPPAG